LEFEKEYFGAFLPVIVESLLKTSCGRVKKIKGVFYV
jgi:hypothetical protein